MLAQPLYIRQSVLHIYINLFHTFLKRLMSFVYFASCLREKGCRSAVIPAFAARTTPASQSLNLNVLVKLNYSLLILCVNIFHSSLNLFNFGVDGVNSSRTNFCLFLFCFFFLLFAASNNITRQLGEHVRAQVIDFLLQVANSFILLLH